MTTKAPASKISVSLPQTLTADLDWLSARMGISRSALIAALLSEAVPEMRRIAGLVPASPTPDELIRLRGESEHMVRRKIAALQAMTDDLFSGGGE